MKTSISATNAAATSHSCARWHRPTTLLRVSFVDFLRGERKFAGIDELRAQLQTDIAQARAALG
ncbi:MAG: hypothetical protein EBT17_01170 [Actinobacteria bacterium]|nr:hypothetical protein [Actinomycetota bacterium]